MTTFEHEIELIDIIVQVAPCEEHPQTAESLVQGRGQVKQERSTPAGSFPPKIQSRRDIPNFYARGTSSPCGKHEMWPS